MKTKKQNQKKSLLIIVFLFLFSKTLFANDPIGFIDRANTMTDGIVGWAVDMDAPWQSINVALFTDDPQNNGQFIYLGSITTNVSRPDVNAALGGIPGNHGYTFTMPSQYRYMNIYVIAINVGAGSNATLTNSPMVVHPDCIKDVTYSYYMDFLTNRPLKLDLYGNFDDDKKPLVVMVHGGGFASGDKSSFEQYAWRIADQGFKVASINYRLMGSPAGTGLPADVDFTTLCYGGLINDIAWYWAIQDLNAAIKFLIYNKEDLKIDEKGIFLYGQSAGAITVLQSAYATQQEIYDELGGSALFNSTWFLGDLDRTTHPPCREVKYKISGVGSVAGALMNPHFLKEKEKTPVVMLHDPCDKLVRFDEGFGYFGTFIAPDFNPFNCVHPEWGSKNIIDRMDWWDANGFPQPCHKLYIVCSTKAYGYIDEKEKTAYLDHGLSLAEVAIFTCKIFPDFANGIYFGSGCNSNPSIEALPGSQVPTELCNKEWRCTDESSPFYNLRTSTYLEGVTAIEGISCGPNPATDLLTVKASGTTEGSVEINILNTQGEVVLRTATSADQSGEIAETISVEKLPAGYYIVTVKGEGYFKKTSMIKTN